MHQIFEVGLFFRLGLAHADDAVTVFPLPAFTQQINTLKAFENCSVFFAAAAEGLETIMLRHSIGLGLK